ncbi:hypothetical protein [uncultured Methylobacterium sp.]|uniref:hypothetical protein n=1 Tax=uncultured Methylobacterium sp. TaxID=157278 RepID=UPI002599F7B5|nr:hypothetical protein [uncultured Methylobacterium sp.]
MKTSIHFSLGEATLNEIFSKLGSHMDPVHAAMRAGCVLITHGQAGHAFDPPRFGIGSIVIVEDDTKASTSGPGGFHRRSIKRLVRRADTFAILSREPVLQAYAEAAAKAQEGGCALIVETSPQHEIAWLKAILTAAPGREILMDPAGPFGRSQ